MTITIPDDPLVARFNARLAQLNSSARVALTRIAGQMPAQDTQQIPDVRLFVFGGDGTYSRR